MKRGLLAQFLALALLASVLVQVVSVEPAEAAFAATPVGLETLGVKDAGLAWADFNEDGCLDVIVTTNNLAGPDQHTQLYRSDCSLPNPTFANVTATHAPGLAMPPIAPSYFHRQVVWGDVNNDGHVDFISQDTTRLNVWINKGPAGAPAYGFGDAVGNPVVLVDSPDLLSGFNMEGGGLLDYDGDGDLDIIMENDNFGIDLWANDGTGTFTWWTPNGDPNGVGLPEVALLGDYAAVTDFDVDGDVDFIGRKDGLVDLWVNTGGAFVSGGFDLAAPNANKGAVAFCDFDDDGLFDLIWTDSPNTQVYRQSPVGTFTATGQPIVPGGSDIDGAACGDVDNDGDLDLFLTDSFGVDLLYPNTSTPGAISFGASTFAGGAGDGEGTSFADYDNDGDLDILLSQSGAANQLWRNDAYQTGATDYLSVEALHDLGGGLSRDALGATLQLFACDGVTALSGVREVNGGRGHGSQDPLAVHFGLPLGSDRAYIVRAQFPTGETTQTAVVPSSIAGYRQTSVTNAGSDLSACQVRGTVFEDVDGNLLPGVEAIGDAANPGRSGVDVRLYQDDGDGTPDGGDTLIDSAVTGAGGAFTLTGGLDVGYWVIADSGDVTPAAGGSGVAEQTYGPIGAWCADGSGGTNPARGSAGACYGGRRADVVDNFAIATNAEHVADVAGPNASDADFGFSFNVVTRTAYVNEQGTFERFIRNANTITGANTMRFVPAVPTNQSGGGGDWWRITVNNGASITDAFPVITGDATTVDGTAHSLIDGTILEGTAGDPNPGSTGYAGAVGTGADGVAGTGDEPTLDGVLKPELEIVNDRAVQATRGLYVRADDFTARRLAIYGFGHADLNDQTGEAFRVGTFADGQTGFLFEDNIIGAGAGGFVDPGTGNRLSSSAFQMSESTGIIRDNLVGFSRKSAIRTWDFSPPGAGLPSILITGNEIRQAGITSDVYDGVDAVRSVGVHLIGNLITESGGDGFDTWTDAATPGDNLVEDNTISFNGRNYFDDTAGSPEPHGMRLFGVDHVVRHNVIHDNYGSGVMVDDDGSGIVITENSMFGNGDLVSGGAPPGPATQKPGIDLIENGGSTEWGEDHLLAVYPTLNDDGDGDSGGNDLQNFPVIDTATIVGTDLVLTGWSAAGAAIEFFIADADLDPFDLGEGETYVTTQTEGVTDGDSGTVGYASPVNGIEQGNEDPVPQFSFTVPLASLASPVVGGDQLTATATVGGQTSEFGGLVTVAGTSFSGEVFEDVAGDAVKDGGDPGRGGVDVRLYLDDGDGLPDGGDTLVGSDITAADGSFAVIGGAGNHWVVVDSSDVTPSSGGSGVAEQTYGPVGAVCTNGDSPETQTSRGTAGPCFGGRRGDVADNFTIASDAEHLALVNGATAGLDFGFSFNVVTRTSDTDTQGTLRRFMNNAITVTGANAMRFVPAVPTNADNLPATDTWWRTDAGSALPTITDAGTTIDGQAYDLADGSTVLDSNDANLGAVQSVGRTGAYTTPQLDPEFEIHGTNAVPYGLDIQAGSAAVRNISIWGFGDFLPAPVDAVIRAGVSTASSFAPPTIERNVIGTAPGSFTDPGAGSRSGGHLIEARGVDGGTIQNNLAGFAGYNVIALANDAQSWTVLTNEVRSSGLSAGGGADRQGGIDIDGDSSGSLLRGNLVIDSAADAIENWESPGGFTIEHNTVENSGQRGVENMAIRVFGTGTVVENNVFEGGSGPAIIVVGANSSAPWPAATGNRLSQNEFRNNAGNSIDLMAASTVVSEYDDGDGITVNDATTIATSGNIGIDYPVITTATDGGLSTTVVGTACAGCRVEIYEALAGSGDTLSGTDYGEGDRYLGLAIADGSGDWSFVDATVGIGDVLSTIVIDAGNNTSEFSPNTTITAAIDISGKVFEDIAGEVLNDGAINTANNPGVGNVTVRLYQDGGDGVPNGVDDGTPIASTTTDPTPGATFGDFSFTGLASGPTYWVVVDSKTVTPSAGVNSSPADDDDVWAEQTYGPAGSYNGVGYAGAAGPFYGGVDGATADSAAALATAEHIARFAATTSAADFGFSFNAVTNLEAGDGSDADGGADRVFQGSMRQFILNANAIAGANVMRFTPAVPTNADDLPLGHTWWSIPITVDLPAIDDGFTTIDGRAYEEADGSTVRNTNDQTLGYVGPVGTGPDGVVGTLDEPTLSGVEAPELQLVGNSANRWAVKFQGSDGAVYRIAAHGFGPAANVPNAGVILVQGADRTRIEENVIGSGAAAFTDPGAGSRTVTDNIRVDSGNDGVVRNNLSGFAVGSGILVNSGTGWLIENNESRGNAIGESILDGVASKGASTTVLNNLIVDTHGGGFDMWNSPGSLIFRNNTVTGNGIGAVNTFALPDETYGIRVIGTGNTLEFNVVNANYGPGILVVQAADTSTISRNSISDNGTILNDASAGPTGQIGIDLIESGHSDDSGLPAPFVTPNAATVGGNGLFDFPVITSAQIVGANLEVAGTSVAGAGIEVLISDGDPGGYGEGETFLFGDAEGSGTDLDPAVGAFLFRVVKPASVSAGTELTTTATSATGATSEFSATEAAVVAGGVAGTIFEDIVGEVLNDGVVGDALNPGIAGVTVRIYRDTNSNNLPDAPDVLVSTQVTGVGGTYSFAGVPAGTYWVTVDSTTLSPAAGIVAGYSASTPQAEQTYGPNGAWCADGSGGTSERIGAGPCYGGENGAAADSPATLSGAEHFSRVIVAAVPISGVDFGFSYNVVTNTQASFAGVLDAPSYQGSLDQFLRNANAVVGTNAMRFVPAVVPSVDLDLIPSSGDEWWRIDYTGTVAGQTPVITHDTDTTVDGTAYDLINGTAVRDTNTGFLGANAGGGLRVGVDDVLLPQVAKPELELMRSDSGIGSALPVDANAATIQIPDNFTVSNVAISGWVRSVWMAGVPGFRPSGVTIENNVLGSGPDTFADPGVPGTVHGLYLRATDGGSLSNNLIGFIENDGAVLADTSGWAISGNEVREAAQVTAGSDGINDGAGSTGNTISGNLIVDSGGFGLDGTSTGDIITNNTITGSGVLGVQTAGIRRTAGPNTISSNILTGNAGAGILVPTGDAGMRLTGNHFGGNGSIAIDLVALGGSDDSGDGVSVNDAAAPVTSGNTGRDYPVVTAAYDTGPSSTIIGTTCANCRVEVYTAVADGDGSDTLAGTDYGEGVTYLGFVDADGSGDWTYVDASLATGSVISTIAIDGSSNTSEFSPNATVVASQGVSGVVFEDIVGDVLNDGVIGDVLNPGVVGATVRLYRDTNANGLPDGADTLISSQMTVAGGAYNFTGLPPATYWVAVDSTTVGTLPAHPEQTYGPVGAWDGSGFSALAGPFYGGAGATTTDAPGSLATAEHVARAIVAGGAVPNVDFGFSDNAVVNLEASGQGSLEQFIINANNVGGANAMYFVPAVPTNATDGTNDWWSLLVSTDLPTVTGDATTFDGAAHASTDGATVRSDNSAALGAAVSPGLDGGYTSPTLDPEFEILGDRSGTPVKKGLDIRADGVTVRNIAIYGFADPDAVVDADLHFWSALNGVVELSVVGGGAASSVAPPVGERSVEAGVAAFTSSTVTVRDSILHFADTGVHSATTSAITVTGNEITNNGFTGITVGNTAAPAVIEGNFLSGNGSFGSIWMSEPATISDNTVQNSSFGIFISSTDPTGSLVTRNVITGNSSDGLYFSSSTANHVQITENHFGGNGGQAIDQRPAGISTNTGVAPACGYEVGTAANDGLDFPVINTAVDTGPSATITGVACANARIEVYRAVAAAGDTLAGTDYGEGTEFLGFTTANAAGDWTYVDAAINAGDTISTLAIDAASNTSEFSANITANTAPIAVDDPGNSTNEDTAVIIAVLGNDSDPDLDPVTISSFDVASANGATIAVDNNGTPLILTDDRLRYDPVADWNGAGDTFTYTVTDGRGSYDTATVTVTVIAVNDEPGFVKGGDDVVLEDSGVRTVAGWATSLSTGPADESGQSLSFNITGNTNAGLFSVAPSVDGVTGDLSYTPAGDANGTATITLEVQDDGGVLNGGDDTSPTQSFVITVTAVNDEPTFAGGGDVGVLEDGGAYSAPWAISLSTGPADESGQSLSFNITGNTNAGLFSVAPSVDGSGGLTFTPAADANGFADITVELQDDGGVLNGGDDTSTSVTFRITVTDVNDEPSFAGGGDVVVLEDSGAYSAPWAGSISMGPANESAQTATFNITGNTNAGLFSAVPAVDASGTLTFTPTPGANGFADITLELQDDGGVLNGGDDTSTSVTFRITVTDVNDEPSFAGGGDVVVLEDSGAYSAPWAGSISMGPANESAQTATFNITGNTNAGLFSAVPAVDASGTLTFTPTPGANGFADITLELQDDGGVLNGGDDTSASVTFRISVSDVNDPPVAVDDGGVGFGTLEDTAFTTGDVLGNDSDSDGSLDALTIVFDDTGTQGTVTNNLNGTFDFDPTGDFNGSTSFDYRVQDDDGDWSNWAMVTLTVTAVNDEPSFVGGGDVGVLEDSGAYSAGWAGSISMGPVDESSQSPTFNVTGNTNAGLFSVVPAVDAAGTLSFTPAGDANGSADITLELQDDGGVLNGGDDTSASVTFTITVTPVNDEPSFIKGADDVVLEDSGARSVAGWATGLSAGPADESAQGLTFNIVGNTNAGLFSVAPSVDGVTGDLSYTPAGDANGTATITLEVSDDGGVLNGGDDTSPTQSFTISVTAVNDEPSFVGGGDVGVLEDSGAYSAGWAGSISMGPANESSQSPTFNVTGNTNAGLFSVVPAVDAAGTLSFTPAGDANGSADITLELQDDGGVLNGGDDTSAGVTFTITVTPVNDEPSFAGGGDVIVLEDSGAYSAPWAGSIVMGPADEVGQTGTFNITSNSNAGLFSAAPGVDGSGGLTFAPAADANGFADITIELQDNGGVLNGGDDTSTSVTFRITVTDVNDPPTAIDDSGPAFNTPEDTAFTTGDVLGNDSDIDGTLDAATIAVDTIGTVGGVVNNLNGTFGFTPAPGWFGTTAFDYRVQDDDGDWSNWATVSVSVSDVNDPPVAVDDGGVGFGTLEDTAFTTGDVLGNDSDSDGSLDALTIVFDDTGTQGTVTNNLNGTFDFDPTGDFNGSTSFDYRVQDDDGDWSNWAMVTLTVTAVNDEPSFVGGGDVGVLEDSGAYSAGWAGSISMGPVDESSQSPTFNVTGNTNAGLFSVVPAVDAAGTLSFTPAGDANGSADITLELQDDGGVLNGGDDTSASVTFTITVTPVNDEPSFIKGADDVVLEDSGARSVAGWATGLSAGPADESAQGLTFNIVGNTNAGLFSVAPSVDGVTGDLSYTPAGDANGTATITLEVSDDGGVLNGGDDTSPTQSFTISVTAVNDEPSFVGGGDVGVLEDSGAYSAGWAGSISMGPANESSQSPTFNVTGNTNAGLFSVVPAVDAAGTLSFTPAGDANGSADITLELQDDGGVLNGGDDTSAGVTFTITVTPVNDEPSFAGGGDVIVLEDSGAYSAPWAGSIVMGPADEVGQTGTFNITSNSNAGLFSAAPGVDGSGGLTFAPAADANGFADITIELQDNGGVLNGGDDTSTSVTFRITVTDVNDPPVASDITVPVNESDPFGTILGTVPVVDIDLPPDTLTWSILSGNADAAFDIDPSTGDVFIIDNSPLNYEVTPTYTLIVQVSDGNGGLDTATVTIDVLGARLATILTDALLVDADGDLLPSAGDTLRYTATITNSGIGSGFGVVFSDLITDPSLDFVPATVVTSQGSVLVGGLPTDALAVVDVGAVVAGDVITITYDVAIDSSLNPGITFVATQGVVSATGMGAHLTDDSDTAAPSDPTTTPVSPTPLLAAAKTAALAVDADGDTVVSPGDTLRYTITVRNDGDAHAGAVEVRDQLLDPQLALVAGSVTTSLGSVTTGNGVGDVAVEVAVGTLPGAGGVVTVEFDALLGAAFPAGTTEVANQASVSSANAPTLPTDDPALPGPADSTLVPVAATPDVTASKDDFLLVDGDGDGVAAPGDIIRYTVVIANGGSLEATGVVFIDGLTDPLLSLVAGSVTTTGGTITTGNESGATTVAVDVGSLAGAGGVATVTFDAAIADSVPNGTTSVSNLGLVGTTPTEDPNGGGPTITALEVGPDLAVTKTDSGVGAGPGASLVYTISYWNQGTEDAAGVVLTETVPAHTSFDAVASGGGWSCSDGASAGTTCTLPVGAVATSSGGAAVFAVTVDGSVPVGVLALSNTTSIADAGSGSPDIDPSNNTFTLASSLGEASISGSVWVDLNNDGLFDAGEPPLVGSGLELTHIASATVTPGVVAADGSFAFGGLAAGSFVVEVDEATVPVGIIPAAPAVTLISSGPGDSVDSGVITVAAGQVWAADFPHIGAGSIAGIVWSDLDGNGALDTGEPGLGGVSVEASASGHTWAAVSDPSGSYRFENLPPDTYRIDVTAGGPADAAVTAGGLPILVGLAPGVNIDSVDIGYHAMADMALAVNLYDTPNNGAAITYLFTVANNGPASSGPVTLTALLPGGFDFVSATGTGWNCTLTTPLVCTGPAMANGASATVAVNGTVAASEGVTLTILGAVNSTTPDGNLSNNQAALSAGVGQLPQTGINADRVGLYGLLLLLAGVFMLWWAVLADRRRRDEEEPFGG